MSEDVSKDKTQLKDVAGAAAGAGVGAVGSVTTMAIGGKVAGLSAAGITSGMAAAGTMVGGGMLSGFLVLAAPIVLGAAIGYFAVKKRRK